VYVIVAFPLLTFVKLAIAPVPVDGVTRFDGVTDHVMTPPGALFKVKVPFVQRREGPEIDIEGGIETVTGYGAEV
jgi:hypothetical protein